jgi:gas vesicle protein
MAQTEDFVTDNPDLGDSGHGRSSREIRSEIDRTRSDMDETFAALDAKMTPREIGLELWSLFKGSSSTGVSKLWQVARDHPMPTAVVGLGLGWLLVDSSRKSDGVDGGAYRGYGKSSYRQSYGGTYAGTGDDFESDEGSGVLSVAKDKLMDVAGSTKDALSGATQKVGDAADWTREHASDLGHQVADKASALSHQAKDRAVDLGHQAKRQANRARLGFWQTMEENPLMVGAAVLALGVVAGLAIPSTDKEDELMGETRDHLLEEAKEAGQQALDKGKHVAEAVADKVKEEVQHQGLSPEGVAEKVRTVAKEAANTAKEEAKRQNLTPDAALNALKPEQPAQQSQPKPQAQGQQQPKPVQPADQGSKRTVTEPELAKR